MNLNRVYNRYTTGFGPNINQRIVGKGGDPEIDFVSFSLYPQLYTNIPDNYPICLEDELTRLSLQVESARKILKYFNHPNSYLPLYKNLLSRLSGAWCLVLDYGIKYATLEQLDIFYKIHETQSKDNIKQAALAIKSEQPDYFKKQESTKNLWDEFGKRIPAFDGVESNNFLIILLAIIVIIFLYKGKIS